MRDTSLALTVHGHGGVVDLLVPGGASARDIAREYAAQCRLGFVPVLHTCAGRSLDPDESPSAIGVKSGAVLLAGGHPGTTALTAVPDRPDRGPDGRGRTAAPAAFSKGWYAVAVAVAGLAGWSAAQTEGSEHDLAILLLTGTAVLGVLPLGAHAPHRVIAAPAFGAAAAFATVWAPEPEKLPMVVGVSALVAAVTAGVASALDHRSEEVLRVWVVTGVVLFVLAGAATLVGASPQVVWGALLVLAMLAARFAPGLAVEVPDESLLDLERLAVTAWSARERPRGRSAGTVVRAEDVATVAARASRTVTAAAAAVWAVVAISAPMLLATATLPVDRIGAQVLVGLAGEALLLTARGYRHRRARTMLRAAGLTALLVVALGLLGDERRSTLSAATIVLGALLVVVAVAVGRGWRSAWWSRRADVAESLAGAGAIAALVVSCGLFRSLWETQFRV